MKDKKGLLYFITTLAVVMVVFNIVAFTIPFNRTSSYWIGYGFTIGAIVISFAVSFYAFRGDLRSKLYGFPLIYLAWGYLCGQTLIGLIFMAISMIPYQVPLIISILLLGAYLIGMMATDMTKEYVENVEKKVKEKTFFIKSLQLDISEIVSTVTDNSLAGAIKDLSDDVKYSDPMSADQLADIESKISDKIFELRELVSSGKNEDAIAIVAEIRKLIGLRNQKCKLLK